MNWAHLLAAVVIVMCLVIAVLAIPAWAHGLLDDILVGDEEPLECERRRVERDLYSSEARRVRRLPADRRDPHRSWSA